jgi:hypothetical protein
VKRAPDAVVRDHDPGLSQRHPDLEISEGTMFSASFWVVLVVFVVGVVLGLLMALGVIDIG